MHNNAYYCTVTVLYCLLVLLLLLAFRLDFVTHMDGDGTGSVGRYVDEQQCLLLNDLKAQIESCDGRAGYSNVAADAHRRQGQSLSYFESRLCQFRRNSGMIDQFKQAFLSHKHAPPLQAFGTSSSGGSDFYFSHNKAYVLKSLNKKELKALLEMLDDLLKHWEKHPKSLLVRYLAIVKVDKTAANTNAAKCRDDGAFLFGNSSSSFFDDSNEGSIRYFVVMPNTFHTGFEVNGKEPKMKKFDLKGATVFRNADDSDSMQLDQNFIRSVLAEGESVKPRLGKAVVKALEKDTKFLTKHGKYDYSLLLGIYENYVCDAASESQDHEQNMRIAPIIPSPRICTTLMSANRVDDCQHPISLKNHGNVLLDISEECKFGWNTFVNGICPIQKVYFLSVVDYLEGYSTLAKIRKFTTIPIKLTICVFMSL